MFSWQQLRGQGGAFCLSVPSVTRNQDRLVRFLTG